MINILNEKRWARLLLNAAIFAGVSLALVERGQAYFRPTPASPSSTVMSIPKPGFDLNAVAAANIFGIPENENQSKALSRTTLNLVVTGLLASEGASSLALISANGQPEAAFATGQDVLPGVQLRAVEHDRVVISRNGALESVPLKELTEGGAVSPLIVASADASSAVPGTSSPWIRRSGLRVAANTAVSDDTPTPTAGTPAGQTAAPQAKTPHAGSAAPGPTPSTTGNYKGIDVKGRPAPSGSYSDIATPRPPSGSLDDIAVGKRPMSSAPPITPPSQNSVPGNLGGSR